MRYKKNSKKCKFCGKYKTPSYFGKDKDYCLTCWNLYFKYLSPPSRGKYRKILLTFGSWFQENPQFFLKLQSVIRDKYARNRFQKELLTRNQKNIRLFLEVQWFS